MAVTVTVVLLVWSVVMLSVTVIALGFRVARLERREDERAGTNDGGRRGWVGRRD